MVSDEITDEVTEESTLDPRVAAKARDALRAARGGERRPNPVPASPPAPAPPPPPKQTEAEGERPTRPAPISIKTPMVALDPQLARRAAGLAEPTPMAVPIQAPPPAAPDAGPFFPDLPPMRAQLPTSPSIISINTVVQRQRTVWRTVAFISGGLLVVLGAFAWRSLKLHQARGSHGVARESTVEVAPVAAKPVPPQVDPVAARPSSAPPAPPELAPLPSPAASSPPSPTSPPATAAEPVAAGDDMGSGPAHSSRALATPPRGASHPAPAARPAAPRAPRPTRPKVFDPTAI
jgi:hypothetical protein